MEKDFLLMSPCLHVVRRQEFLCPLLDAAFEVNEIITFRETTPYSGRYAADISKETLITEI